MLIFCRNIVLLLVGFVIAAVLIGGSQGGVHSTKPNPTPAPAPTESSLSWPKFSNRIPIPRLSGMRIS